jgi:hypothetical protein
MNSRVKADNFTFIPYLDLKSKGQYKHKIAAMVEVDINASIPVFRNAGLFQFVPVQRG